MLPSILNFSYFILFSMFQKKLHCIEQCNLYRLFYLNQFYIDILCDVLTLMMVFGDRGGRSCPGNQWGMQQRGERGERQRDLSWHFDGTSPGQCRGCKPTSDLSPGPHDTRGSYLGSCHCLSVSCALSLFPALLSPATFYPIKQYPAQNMLTLHRAGNNKKNI